MKQIKVVSEEFIPLKGTIIYTTDFEDNLAADEVGIFIPEDNLFEKTITPLNRVYEGGVFTVKYKNLVQGLNVKYNKGDVLGRIVIVKKAFRYVENEEQNTQRDGTSSGNVEGTGQVNTSVEEES